MSQLLTPRVFVSAASSDLRSARKVVNDALTRIECLPIEESVFGTEYGKIREMIAHKIASCHAVIHLVGRDYGGEPAPQTLPAGQPRRSWTQIEYDLAEVQQPKQKLYLLVCDDAFPFDPLAVPEPADKTALQLAHRQAVLAGQHLWHSVRTLDELQRQIENLKVPLNEVRAEIRRQQIRERLVFGLATAAIVLVLGGVIYGVNQLGKKVDETGGQVTAVAQDVKQVEQKVDELPAKVEEAKQQTIQQLTDPAALAETIRKQIRATAEAKIKAIAAEQGGWRKEQEIEKERDLALGRVDDLIKLIQEGLKEGASPVFQKATEILQNQGTDEALAYLESSRPSTVELAKRYAEQAKATAARAKAEKEQRNKTLQALMLEAELLETKLQWRPALQLREQVAELAPDWFDARNDVGKLLQELARYAAAEPHHRAALALVTNSADETIALSNLASLLQHTNRFVEAEPLDRRSLAIVEQSFGTNHPLVATQLSNLASLLQAMNRLTEAELLMRRALAIVEQSYGTEHPRIAVPLNNFATLLQATNRLELAEPLMRRALTIDEHSYGDEHPRVASNLNNLATLLQDTNRLAEAEPLTRRALIIDEQSFGAGHPRIATPLSNLATLLQATNRLAEAEPLMHRALAIDEQTYGPEHPKVASHLLNLASLLQDRNRLAEAEPLKRRALAIDMQSYGAEHPQIAIGLNNLASLLQHTNRIAEAEPLRRRALVIVEQSYGCEHLDVAGYLYNLSALLQDTNRLMEAEPLMRRALLIASDSKRRTGHEPRDYQVRLNEYSNLLQAMRLPEDEIAQRVKDATAIAGRLKPIVPEVERLLGPAQSVTDVLAGLDRQYKADGKPAVYFLLPGQPIVPHLVELLRPNIESLDATATHAYYSGAHADAIVLEDEILKLLADKPDQAATTFTPRVNRAAALRELGEVEPARDELRKLLSGLREGDTITTLAKGHARFHLALCEWRLNDREAAQREAEESLKEYGDDADAAPQKKQTEQLLADLKENKPLPPLAKVDAVAVLEQARVRSRARAELATLPLNQSALPLLDQMLGPAESTKQVFERLDRQYREQNKSAIWFLPLSQPIAPHLDELLGPLPSH